jgi:hypothetical protein
MAQGGNEPVGENNELNTVKVRTNPCWICGQYSFVEVPGDVWEAYQAHDIHIEKAWPYGPAEARNLIVTGIHTSCWDAEFPDTEIPTNTKEK